VGTGSIHPDDTCIQEQRAACRVTYDDEMTRIKTWYKGLSHQWKATLRTALQNVLGALSIFVVAMFASLANMISGETVDLVQDASNAARLSLLALLSVASGLWAYIMNASKDEPVRPLGREGGLADIEAFNSEFP
jgi:hypothetical protein